MRLLEQLSNGDFALTEKLNGNPIPPYAILSHTWGSQEVTYEEMVEGSGRNKAGHAKIEFCGKQAARDGLRYFWVDSCCIKKSSDSELSESLNCMFRWYQRAEKCYVYISDVSTKKRKRQSEEMEITWEQAFRKSKWFTRGWTLQELLAPRSVEFFSQDGSRLGDKHSLEQQIHGITGIPTSALRGAPLSQFGTSEKFDWAKNRCTTREEDWAYSLLGIFEISMPVIYGEGRANAVRRLTKEVNDASMERELWPQPSTSPSRLPNTEEIAPHANQDTLPSKSSLIRHKQTSFVSSDLTGQRHLAEIYGELGQQRMLLQNLKSSLEGFVIPRHESTPAYPIYGELIPRRSGNPDRASSNATSYDVVSAHVSCGCAPVVAGGQSTASVDTPSTGLSSHMSVAEQLAFETLKTLCVPHSSLPSLSHFNDPSDGLSAQDIIMLTNQTAITMVFRILSSEDAGSPLFPATIAFTITKILSRYETMAGVDNPGSDATLRTQSILTELRRVDKLVDKFGERYCKPADPARSNIDTGLFWDLEAVLRTSVRGTFKKTMKRAPDEVKRKVADFSNRTGRRILLPLSPSCRACELVKITSDKVCCCFVFDRASAKQIYRSIQDAAGAILWLFPPMLVRNYGHTTLG
jgi:hypothetical protein